MHDTKQTSFRFTFLKRRQRSSVRSIFMSTNTLTLTQSKITLWIHKSELNHPLVPFTDNSYEQGTLLSIFYLPSTGRINQVYKLSVHVQEAGNTTSNIIRHYVRDLERQMCKFTWLRVQAHDRNWRVSRKDGRLYVYIRAALSTRSMFVKRSLQYGLRKNSVFTMQTSLQR